MRTLILAAALIAAVPASAAERRFPVGNFDRIEAGGADDVTVTTGHAVSVVATGDQDRLDRLDIRVEDGVLKIGYKRESGWKFWERGETHIAISVPSLRGAKLAGSGNVSIDRASAPAFEGGLAGSGDLRLGQLDTKSLMLDIAGSGTISAAGRCDSARMSIAGSGGMKIAGLTCATLAANIAGSGNIDAHATGTAAISIMGSGDVRVRGGARCTISKHGSGSADCG